MGARYHSLAVAREGFPEEELKVTAWVEDGTIMGLRHRKYPWIQARASFTRVKGATCEFRGIGLMWHQGTDCSGAGSAVSPGEHHHGQREADHQELDSWAKPLMAFPPSSLMLNGATTHGWAEHTTSEHHIRNDTARNRTKTAAWWT